MADLWTALATAVGGVWAIALAVMLAGAWHDWRHQRWLRRDRRNHAPRR